MGAKPGCHEIADDTRSALLRVGVVSASDREADIARLGLAANFAVFILVGGLIAAITFAGGAGSLYGIGFDWSWRLVDSGHIERHGLTTKTSRFRIPERPRVIMLPGEVLEIDYTFEAERGTASVSVGSYGWVLFLGSIDRLASASPITPPANGTLRATANRTGFHEIRVYLSHAVGTIEADWRIVNARPAGRLMRGARLTLFALGGLLIALVVVALVVHGGRRLVGADD